MRMFMEDRYVTESELVARLGIPYDHVESLLSGTSPVTQELAPKLGEVLGFNAEFWLGLQQGYEDTIRRNNAREAAGINTNVYKMLDADGHTCEVRHDYRPGPSLGRRGAGRQRRVPEAAVVVPAPQRRTTKAGQAATSV